MRTTLGFAAPGICAEAMAADRHRLTMASMVRMRRVIQRNSFPGVSNRRDVSQCAAIGLHSFALGLHSFTVWGWARVPPPFSASFRDRWSARPAQGGALF